MDTPLSKACIRKCCHFECPINVHQCSVRFLVPPLRSWLHRLKSTVLSVLQKDRSKGMGSTPHVNTFPMIRWVLRRMREGCWTLLPRDKEPGFSFIRHSETRDVAIASLVPGSYTETHCDEMQLPGWMKAYCVCRQNVLVSCTANELNPLSYLRNGVKVLQRSARSGCCAKTTKGPGEVTFKCVALWSIEHVDRFVSMAGIPSS